MYHRRGDVFQKLFEFEKAMEYKNRALSIAIDLGNAFRGLCSYHKAIGFYKRCLSVAKGLSGKTIRWSLESIAYSNLGHAFDFLGDYKGFTLALPKRGETSLERQKRTEVLATFFRALEISEKP